jgi:hypothetical protein
MNDLLYFLEYRISRTIQYICRNVIMPMPPQWRRGPIHDGLIPAKGVRIVAYDSSFCSEGGGCKVVNGVTVTGSFFFFFFL